MELGPLFHSVAKAAVLLGLSEMTLYRAIKEGAFPAVRVRNRILVPVQAIDDMIRSATSGNTLVDAASWVAPEGVA